MRSKFEAFMDFWLYIILFVIALGGIILKIILWETPVDLQSRNGEGVYDRPATVHITGVIHTDGSTSMSNTGDEVSHNLYTIKEGKYAVLLTDKKWRHFKGDEIDIFITDSYPMNDYMLLIAEYDD